MTSSLPACCTIAVLVPWLNNSMEEGGSDSRSFLYMAAMSMPSMPSMPWAMPKNTGKPNGFFVKINVAKSLHICE